MERTHQHEMENEARPFVYMMVKPLGLEPAVHADMMQIIETRGVITHREGFTVKREQIQRHYDGIKLLKDGSPSSHFTPITEYLTGKQVQALIIEDYMGSDADEFVTDMRALLGNSNPMKTEEGQIRNLALKHVVPFIRVMPRENDYDQAFCRDNLAHCSDSLEAAALEIGIWLPEKTDTYMNKYEKLRQT